MPKNFTPAQRRAIRVFDADVRVIAGPGTGKTAVLVERFLHAMTERGIDPERILAITFTEKAANEMKSRLAAECSRRGLVGPKRRLENSYISTIHGFCARVLRENPVESGLEPFFQILSEGESELWMNKALDLEFEKEAGNELWIRLVCDFGERPLRAAMKGFYATLRATGQEVLYHDAFDPERRQAEAVLKKLLAELPALVGARPQNPTEEDAKAGAEALLGILSSGAEGWEALGSALRWESSFAARGKLKDPNKSIQDALAAWMALKAQQLLEPPKKELSRIFSEFAASYDAQKKSRSFYDFDDLVAATHRLFHSTEPIKKSVRDRYLERFECILVDEFQDTSPLQAAIIDALRKPRGLFVVGDPQQAIYGFRHADPSLFGKLKSEGVRMEEVVLSDNFRSKKPVLSFVNGLFCGEGAPFVELKAAKAFKSNEGPAIEVVCVPRGSEETDGLDEARVLEAAVIADRIQELVVSKTAVEEGGKARPLRYRDIAVLMRATTSSYFYEKELADRAIPYFTAKGRGFYEKPEILDLVHCLQLLENPSADIALAGVLRSPLVGLSDDGLFWLAQAAKRDDAEAPLWRAFASLEKITALSEEDRKKLTRFRTLLESLRAKKESLGLSRLLRLLLAENDYEAKILTEPGGRQKYANLRKLVQMAETAEGRGAYGIADFVSLVEGLSEREIPEAEAKLQSQSSDAVTLLSVHAAKGLEFPVVVIANMGGGASSKNGRINYSKERGLGLSLKDGQTGAFFADWSFLENEKGRKAAEAEESRRLLYVAMTRAEERLILAGSLELKDGTGLKADDSWMGFVRRRADWAQRSDTVQLQAKEKPRQVLRGASNLAFRLGLDKKQKPLGEADLERAGISFEKRRVRPRSLADKPYPDAEDHAVTELVSFFEKKSGYQKASEEEPEALGAGDEEALPRNEYGTLYHRAMEELARHKPAKIPSSFFSRHFLKALAPSQKKELETSARRFWAGPWGRRIRAAKRSFPELPFIYKTSHGLLKGQIDLLLEECGGWTILDYKTNRVPAADKETLAQVYRPQLLLYGLVFKRLLGRLPARVALYFSALDESLEWECPAADLESLETELQNYFQKEAFEGSAAARLDF